MTSSDGYGRFSEKHSCGKVGYHEIYEKLYTSKIFTCLVDTRYDKHMVITSLVYIAAMLHHKIVTRVLVNVVRH